ncbi:hypothetical protein ACGFSB_04325 [Streptomyces sp. NPDC048441]|uniref:hypothetical protein n=1 Tax=Streptomyces sp. NPDC048441 TaxID=3365552 RepID=UPI00371EFCB1
MSFDTLEDAKAWLRRAGTDSERGEFVDPRDGSIMLADYVTRFWKEGVRAPLARSSASTSASASTSFRTSARWA